MMGVVFLGELRRLGSREKPNGWWKAARAVLGNQVIKKKLAQALIPTFYRQLGLSADLNNW